MSDPFLGEIRLYPYNFVPQGYLPCDGRLLPVNQYQALYSLLGVQFGGTAGSNFALPDLRGRTPVCAIPGLPQGTRGGAEGVALTLNQMPAHSHVFQASKMDADAFAMDAGKLDALATASGAPQATPPVAPKPAYVQSGSPLLSLAPNTCGTTGAGALHENRQPSLALQFCIAVTGLYPPRQ